MFAAAKIPLELSKMSSLIDPKKNHGNDDVYEAEGADPNQPPSDEQQDGPSGDSSMDVSDIRRLSDGQEYNRNVYFSE